MPVKEQVIDRNRYKVVPRSLIFLFKDDEVLLIKGASQKTIWANVYNGVGGHIEQGENVIQAADRELFEETGLTNQSLWICGNIMIDTGDKDTGILLFVLRGEYQGGKLIDSEEGDLAWISVDSLDSVESVEDLSFLIPLVYHHNRNEPIFTAKYNYDESGRLLIGIQGLPASGSNRGS